MKVAIYARLSSEKEDDSLQLPLLHFHLRPLTWEEDFAETEYIERLTDNGIAEHRALDQLMFDARLKKFDAVVIAQVDRFGRSLEDLIQNVNTLETLGIRLYVLGIRTEDRKPMAIGKVLLQLFNAFAEFDLLSRRAPKTKLNRTRGRPRRVFPREVALDLRRKGMSWRAISRKLGIPQSTVRATLAGVQKIS